MNRLRVPLSDNNVRRLIALAALGVLATLSVYGINHRETGEVSKRVTRIEAKSPCLAFPHSKLCHRSFSAAIRTVTPGQVCYLFALVDVTPAECRATERRREASEVEALPAPPEAAPAKASPAPEHATSPVAVTPPKGGEAPPTGAPGPGLPPAKGTPPVPEPTGPVPPSSEAGSSPAPPEEGTAPPPPAETASEPSLIENVGGLFCSVVARVGVPLCPGD